MSDMQNVKITGVKVKKIKVFNDSRGDFREILRADKRIVNRIAQVSIGKTLPGIIKAFHWHNYQDDIFYVLKGNIKLVLYDGRKNSKTKKATRVMFLGESFPPQIVFIPRGVYHGYKVLGDKEAEVLYMMNNLYDPTNPDEQRASYDDKIINFDWRDKILIIGAGGYLGTQLMKDTSKDYRVTGAYYPEKDKGISLDITNKKQVKDVINKESPDIVILTAAKTNVEACEIDPEDTMKINTLGAKNVVDNLKYSKLVFFSTDSVFDGTKREYSEEDIPNPINVYGRSKLDAEKIVSSYPNHLICRTSRLYGPGGNKFLNLIIDSLRQGNKIKVPVETPGNFSLLEDVSKTTIKLIKRRRKGIYHVAGLGAYSFDEAAYKTADVFGFNKLLIKRVGKTFFNKKVKRPNSPLNINKLAREKIKMSSLEEGLKKIKESTLETKDKPKKYKEVKNCRICASKNLISYLNLGEMPLANSFITKARIEDEERFPLNILLCKDCYLSQLSVVVDPKRLFSNYAYRSSISDSFNKHCCELAKELSGKILKRGDLVVDIASNDGSLLIPFKRMGGRVLGIEPAKNIAKIANDSKIETISKFWSTDVAKKINKKYKKAKIITAFNVFAHVDDMHEFIEGAKILLDKTGYLIIESPHLLNLIENTEFDTVYHEHLSYLLLKPLQKLIESHGLKIAKVKTYDIHGGSIRMYIEHSDQNRSDGSLQKIIAKEQSGGLYNTRRYLQFKNEVEKIKKDLVNKLDNLKKRGNKISGFAASAKGNTLLNYCNIDHKIIDFIFDDTPEKQNKLFAGVHIPVISPKYIANKKPDYLLVLAWNFAKEIISKTKHYQLRGGKYILPIPSLRIK